ncbi:hypothetical protein JW935_25765 [candidate division KSB1 bacterium]|nr:hypothetical protein [candidate division KSB1 bacterium]
MKRVFNKANNKQQAEQYDIEQQISMTPDERLSIVDELKRRVFGDNVPDLRKAHQK